MAEPRIKRRAAPASAAAASVSVPHASVRLGRAWLGALGLIALPFLAGHASAQNAPGASTIGLWSTEDRGGVVRIAPCGASQCGTIVGLSFPPDGVKVDVHGTPQCHLLLLKDLLPANDGRLHGTITNPEDGRVYSAEVWVPADGYLRLRGYIGLPIFGSTQRWPPYHGKLRDDCRFQKPAAG